jgi:DNA-binding transcriptional ArsR family regulator
LIAEKLGVSQPTVTEHMRLLVDIGAVRAKRIKQWTFYKRDEERIRALKAGIVDAVRGGAGTACCRQQRYSIRIDGMDYDQTEIATSYDRARAPTKRLAAAATSAQPVLREGRCDAARRGDGACAHRPDDK